MSNPEKQNVLLGKIKEVLGAYGLFYILILAMLVTLGYFYIKNIGYVTSMSKVPLVYDTIQPVSDLPLTKGTLSPPVDVKLFLNPSAEIINKGKSLYDMNCASCHGVNGLGDGVAGAMLNPKPRNFTDMANWTNGNTIEGMYKTLQEGITSRGMASYSNLPPEDRLAMISYIRTLSPNYPKLTDTDLQTLDVMYSLSKGSMMPNQIPVSKAMGKLIEEYGTVESKIDSLATIISKDKDNPAAVIFRSMTNNLNKALTSLNNNTRWNENENEFVNFIMKNPVQNGFKTESISMSKENLTLVFNYIRNIYNSLNMFKTQLNLTSASVIDTVNKVNNVKDTTVKK